MSNVRELYEAWSTADAEWTKAIRAAFPSHWPGDIRYTPKAKGEPNSPLRAAYDARTAAQNAFYQAGGRLWLQNATLEATTR